MLQRQRALPGNCRVTWGMPWGCVWCRPEDCQWRWGVHIEADVLRRVMYICTCRENVNCQPSGLGIAGLLEKAELKCGQIWEA